LSSEDKEITTLTYEQAIAELDGLIGKLEGGEVALADAVVAYERGAKLAQHCADLLDRTEAQVTQLMVSGSGKVTEKPLEVSGTESKSVESKPAQAPLPRARKATSAEMLFGASVSAPTDDPVIDPDEIPF
jgi:exodeoxyribonuclease VII small subunit